MILYFEILVKYMIRVHIILYTQPPQEKILGQRMVQKGTVLRKETDSLFYIPLLESLRQMLQMDLVLDCVGFKMLLTMFTQSAEVVEGIVFTVGFLLC